LRDMNRAKETENATLEKEKEPQEIDALPLIN
jgi:hypothetical protein